MSKPSGNRAGLFIAVLSICLLIPQIVSAQYTAKYTAEEQKAIDAVTAYLKDVGETTQKDGKEGAAEIWVENWASGTYSFGVIEYDAEVAAGSSRITFSNEMIRQLTGPAQRGRRRRTISDWAATFKHELVHTKQNPIAMTASMAKHLVGSGHPLEADAWAGGFASYWKWLRLANAKYMNARDNSEDKEKYAKQVVDLAESFKSYYSNFKDPKLKNLGPLPESLRFKLMLGKGGREDAPPVAIEEAVREANKISKDVSSKMHITVWLSKEYIKVKAGEKMELFAHPENVWSPSSGKGSVSFTWKAGSKKLEETGAFLSRRATVDEWITVIAFDTRQKATASCQVIVVKEKPAVKDKSVTKSSAAKTVAKTLPTVPATKTLSPAQKGGKTEYAWVLIEIVDYEYADRWATADAHPSYVYSHSYSRGVYSASTTYEGNDPYGSGLSGTLGLMAVFTGVPKIIYPDQPVSLNLSFTVTKNNVVKLAFGGAAGADFDKWDVEPGGVTRGSRSFVNKDGKSSFIISTSNNAPSYNETLTGHLGSGTEGGRIALRTRFSMNAPMGTNYIYEWKHVDTSNINNQNPPLDTSGIDGISDIPSDEYDEYGKALEERLKKE